MSLTKYQQKRNFKRTSEPRGKKKSESETGMFVVQKHDASHLHYDFRLEHNGVLKSWAVPKGPSLDPQKKRLAVQVEDHPVEYGSFEGTIPEGEYGGGTVMLWDRGIWSPEGDATKGLRSGRLKFRLDGEKLHGRWMLVRRGGNADKPNWLLFKLKDEQAKAESKFNVVERLPNSVATDRSLDEIADSNGATWHADRKSPKSRGSTRSKSSSSIQKTLHKRTDRNGRSDVWARPIDLQLPTLVTSAPDGDNWLHEFKLDGYRMLCYANGNNVRFETRNHIDLSSRLPELVVAMRKLKLKQTILDGEVVAFAPSGVTDFQLLQNAFRQNNRSNVVFCVFDLLAKDGKDLRSLSLEDRKLQLETLPLSKAKGAIRISEYLIGQGPLLFERACKADLEGIVSKRRDVSYTAGRGTNWVKTKCQQHAEFVIGGYTDPTGTRHGFGSLLLGYYENDEFKYAGRVGTGFDDEMLTDLASRLRRLEQSSSPFANFPPRKRIPRGHHWVIPKLIAQVRFSNWTRDKLLRHPVFKGLRIDKRPQQITRETPRKVLPTKNQHASPTSRSASLSAKETTVEGVRLTHPNKILFPDDGISKKDLAEYYVTVAEYMMPLVTSRPVVLVRCPDGINGERFFQKHPGHVAPDEMKRFKIREKHKTDEYLVIENLKSLIALTQISAVELHIWGSRIDSIEKPDVIVLDLDPALDVAWKAIITAAQEIKEFLAELGLQSFVKTSGGKGLHICIPLKRTKDWNYVSQFGEDLARAIERAAPSRYVANMAKKKRVGKIFVDYLRNQRGSTFIAPFSTRARDGAPVSVPLTWRQLPKLQSADQFQRRDVHKWLKSHRESWADFTSTHQQLTAKMHNLLQS